MIGEGTPHCPHCSMPLFANTFTRGGQAPALGGEWLSPHVLLVDDLLPRPGDVIEAAEELARWEPMAVVGRAGAGFADHRRGDQSFVTGHVDPGLEEPAEVLRIAFHAAAEAYLDATPHIFLRSDLGFQLLRYPEGGLFHEHVDVAPGSDGVPGQRQLSALLYLNDDYEGGELHLPGQGLRYNPKAGSMILFPSNFCFPHESVPVRTGTKYTVATWFL